MSAPVLPIFRKDGYFLIDKGVATFVPLVKPPTFAELVNSMPDRLFHGGQAGKDNIIDMVRGRGKR